MNVAYNGEMSLDLVTLDLQTIINFFFRTMRNTKMRSMFFFKIVIALKCFAVVVCVAFFVLLMQEIVSKFAMKTTTTGMRHSKAKPVL